MAKKTFTAKHSLMIQGTTSDAGKSIMVTAVCRMLARSGISVAPFKAQNMALNSAVTPDGGEIGRAQAVQAAACYLPPSIEMNPVLIKPNSDLGAQVIVNGKAIGNMQAGVYHNHKPELLKTVVAAHDKLAAEHQAVIIEGAGSPAEVNLRDRDIVNMGLAEEIDCPVVIVADIDRGGVLAHLYGTYDVLSETEKQRVVGFIINRFRGDVGLLEPGLKWLEQKTTVPVLAVIPYIHQLHVESEDSVAQEQLLTESNKLHVVIIGYPRMSNHTDFDVLRMHPQVNCQYVRYPSEFNGADLIILPGSKNVRGDLRWLKEQGFSEKINKHLRYGGKLLGICGGLQMLGQKIHDPDAIEEAAGSSDGLGLLDMQTTLTGNKTLRNVSGSSVSSGNKVAGYEIHAGVTTGAALDAPLFELCLEGDEKPFYDGAASSDGSIRASYVHGLLDNAEMMSELLSWAGLDDVEAFDYERFRDKEIDRLADCVEQAWPLDAVKALIDLAD